MGRKLGAGATVVRGERAPAPDVNGRKTASLETAHKREHDLVPLLTHELGNQLTVVQGFAEMLVEGLDGSLPPDMARQFADAILRNAKQMSGLIETVSDVRKLDHGALALHLVDVDLATLVRDAVPELERLLGPRPLTLDLTPAAVVSADAVRIHKILTHLISNAAKFTPPDASVVVAVAAEDDRAELSVTDSGPGIPADERGQLFEKSPRRDAKAKGLGMGLYVSRGLARAHGGDLVFLPHEVGCRMVLQLPRTAGASGS